MTKNIAILTLIVSVLLVAVAVAGFNGKSINIYDYDATSVDVAGF